MSVLDSHRRLIDCGRVAPLAIETACMEMAPATKEAIILDLKCFFRWCALQRPIAIAVPATPETLVGYLRWLERGTAIRVAVKPATMARRMASIARVHRILGFGEAEPLPTQAGAVRGFLKAARCKQIGRQRQAVPLRFRKPTASDEARPIAMTVQALLASCDDDLVGLRDAALVSMIYDAGLRVSELVAVTVSDLHQMVDGSGRLEIVGSAHEAEDMGSAVWLSPRTMKRLSAWLKASQIRTGPIFRRINILKGKVSAKGPRELWHHLGAHSLTRQGVAVVLRHRAATAITRGLVEIEPGEESYIVEALTTRSFRVGLAHDLLAAGEDGAAVALALRWSSPATALRYAREVAAADGAAARVIGMLQSSN